MSEYGAPIERGEVKEAVEDGYRIASLTRPGVITPPIPALFGSTFEAGARVYFFMFEDGRGGILAAMD